MKKCKKIISVILCISLVLTVTPAINSTVSALSDEEISAPSAVLLEPSTSRILYAKNENEQRACASVTKVMTLLLVMEALDDGQITLDEPVTTSEHAASMGGSDIWLEPGEVMSVNDMIKAVAVASANDAAVALAEHISGSEESFVAKMNERAKELGMNNTTFKNCNGLDEEGHVTTAYDVALMSKELIKHEEIFNYTTIWMDTLRDGKTQIVNTNKLLKSYKGANGLKTGTTSEAGCCIAATAERNGMTLLAVVLGANTGTERFDDATKLLDYGFSNYSLVTPALPDDVLDSVPVTDGMQKYVDVTADLPESLILSKDEAKGLTTEVVMNEDVAAPVIKGDVLGEVFYKVNSITITKAQIKAAEDVDSISFSSVFELLCSKLIN